MVCFNAESWTFRVFEYDLADNPIDTGIEFSLNANEIKEASYHRDSLQTLATYMLTKVYGFSDRITGYTCSKEDGRVDFCIRGYSTETRINTKYWGLKRVI